MSHFLIRPLSIAVILLLSQSIEEEEVVAADSPIYRAAKEYRVAVRSFERTVLKTPKVHSSVERLVDDLEDSTSRLKSAAADPGRFDRIRMRFQATCKLHARVELVFFGDPLLPPDPVLEASWYSVAMAYSVMESEFQYLYQLRSAKRCGVVPVVEYRDPPAWGQINPLPRPVDLRPGSVNPRVGDAANFRTEASSTRPPRQPFTRRVVETRDGLRKAVIGAMLQRR